MAESYDIVLVQGETTLNHMLVKTDNKKLWNVSDAPLLPPTLVTGDASPSNIAPDRAIRISQDDWRKGFQDLMLDDPKKYYKSVNTDGRFKGKVILSPKELTAISFAAGTAPTIVNADMETATSGWTDATRDADPHHLGEYSYKMDSEKTRSYQDLAGNPLGIAVTWNCYVYAEGVLGDIKLGIDDGVDETLGDDITGAGAWYPLSVTKTLSTSATRLRLVIYRQNYNDIVNFDDATISVAKPTFGSTAQKINFGSDIVLASGAVLAKLDSGAFKALAKFGATITKLCVYGNRLFIALGLSNAFYYTSDLITFTKSTLTGGITARATKTTAAYDHDDTSIAVVDYTVFSGNNVYARWEDEVIKITTKAAPLTVTRGQLGSTATVHALGTTITELATVTGAKFMSNVGGYQFWISDTNNTLRDSDNPINNGTPFSTPYTLPNSAYNITGLVDDDEVVYVRKQDQVYYLSGADVYSLIPELAAEVNTTFSYGIYPWKGKLYLPSGVNSLYEYDDGIVTVLSPTRYAVGDTDFDEEILALAGDETYLYAVINNGDNIEILAGRWETIDGDTDWVWHPLYEKTCNDITSALISNISGSKRLYLGTDTAADGIFNFIVPVSYSDVLEESGYGVKTSGDFITPWFRSNFPTKKKYWKSIDVTSFCLTNVTSIAVYYQRQGYVAWVSLGDCTQTATVPAVESTDTFTIGISSTRIRFKFSLATTNDSASPVLYGLGGGYGTDAILQSTRKKAIEATILIAPTWRERNNSVISRTMATDLTALRTLYASTSPITLTGPEATVYTVLFDREGHREELAYDETGRIENYWVTIKCLEV